MNSYLLFHSLVEILSATISFGTFLFAWNTRRFQNSYLRTLGIAAAFVGLFEALHCLAFPGMPVFSGYDDNLSPQLWLSARLFQAGACLAGLLLLRRVISPPRLLAACGVAFVALCAAVFMRAVPDAVRHPAGLTAFKVTAEWALAGAFLLSVPLLFRVRDRFAPKVFGLLVSQNVVMAACEVSFTLYSRPFDVQNLVGHLLLVAGEVLQYGAILRAGLLDPSDTYFRDFTRANEALRESEERLELALEAAGQVPWEIDLETGTVTGSRGLCALFGLDDPNAMRTREDWRRFVVEDDRTVIAQAIERVIEGDGDYALEYRICRGDNGETRWIATVGRVARDGGGRAVRLVGVATDVTERRRSEDARARLAAIVEWSDDAIVSKDLAGIVTSWNAGAERLLGYVAGEIVGKSVAPIVPPDLMADEQNIVECVRVGGHVEQLETVRLAKDGRRVEVSVSMSPLKDAAGRTVGVSTIMRDITARKRAEAVIKAAHEALAEADQRKDEFLAVLSHELRNPLAAIRYAVPLVQQEHAGEAGARALTVIDRQVAHLTRLVDDLLDIARITRGKIELRREYITLESVVKAATEASSPAIAAARHVLRISVPEEPVWLHADAARLAQVLTNLLNNSARYTPRGGEIRVEACQDCDRAIVRVRDTGIGIPAESLTTIFDMFRQVDRPDRTQGGLGIGLALVKRLVEMHGGTIEAHSAGVGLGAEFVLALPVAVERSELTREQTATKAERARALRVLAVDDNADLVEMLAVIVEQCGHEVRKALDGRSAVSAALSFRPHVVLLDLGLPIMNGIEVARELRRRPELAGVRLVALTGWGQAEDRRQTLEAGFDEHLTKPTDPSDLERLLSAFASERTSGV